MSSKDTDSEAVELENLLNKFFEHFQCAVCMSQMNVVFITKPCAHRFCERCIKQCINEHRKCPLCNERLNSYDDIVKDCQFDDLMSNTKALKEKNQDKFFEKINPNSSELHKDENFKPLEKTLQRHYFESLKSFETYYSQIKTGYLFELEKIDKNEDARQKLGISFKNTINTVCKSFENFLNDNLNKPKLADVDIEVKILGKNLTFPKMNLKMNEDISEVINFAKTEVSKLDDKINEINDLVILCFGPLSKPTAEEVKKIYDTYVECMEIPEELHKNVQVIPSENCLPILNLLIKPESTLYLCGKISFDSDYPTCFCKAYIPGTSVTMDYFACKTCDLKWLCKNCCRVCHENHDCVPFIQKHKATWACCYCKRKHCILIDN